MKIIIKFSERSLLILIYNKLLYAQFYDMYNYNFNFFDFDLFWLNNIKLVTLIRLSLMKWEWKVWVWCIYKYFSRSAMLVWVILDVLIRQFVQVYKRDRLRRRVCILRINFYRKANTNIWLYYIIIFLHGVLRWE